MLLYADNGLGEGLKINGSFLIDRVATSDHSHVCLAQKPFLLFPSVNLCARAGGVGKGSGSAEKWRIFHCSGWGRFLPKTKC